MSEPPEEINVLQEIKYWDRGHTDELQGQLTHALIEQRKTYNNQRKFILCNIFISQFIVKKYRVLVIKN